MAGYGDTPRWEPMTPRLRPLRLLVAWVISAASVWVAAGLVPGVELGEPGSAFLVAAGVAVLNAVLPPVIAALRLPWMLAVGFLAVLLADALALVIAADVLPDALRVESLAARAARGARDGRHVDRSPGDRGNQRRRRVLAAGDPADSAPSGRHGDPPGRRGDRLSRDRRARPARAAPCDARWQRTQPGSLDGGGRLPARRVGAGPVLADRRQPGRHPARLERGHPRVPVGGEGDREVDDLLGAGRLRRDRAPPLDRGRAAGRRRLEPREPALRGRRRGDPDRQPDGCREAGQPRLPRLPRERLQRDPGARALRLGGGPGVDRGASREPPRRPAARSPRRDLPVHPRRRVRDRP